MDTQFCSDFDARRIGRRGLNTRLIANVQAKASAHVHEAANLLQRYYTWGDVFTVAMADRDDLAAAEANRAMREAELQLRRFLGRIVSPFARREDVFAEGQECVAMIA